VSKVGQGSYYEVGEKIMQPHFSTDELLNCRYGKAFSLSRGGVRQAGGEQGRRKR